MLQNNSSVSLGFEGFIFPLNYSEARYFSLTFIDRNNSSPALMVQFLLLSYILFRVPNISVSLYGKEL